MRGLLSLILVFGCSKPCPEGTTENSDGTCVNECPDGTELSEDASSCQTIEDPSETDTVDSDPADGGSADGGSDDGDSADGGSGDGGSVDGEPAETDEDGDGISDAEDCDDSDVDLGARENDQDCDGIITAEDGDDDDPTVGHYWLSIDPGDEQICGIISAGNQVRCRGYSHLGISETESSFTSIEVSDSDYSCGITTDGNIECWGDFLSLYPELIPATGTFIDIGLNDTRYTGDVHACGVTSTGGVECWGDDGDGVVSDVPSGTFESVSVGSSTACGVKSSGLVECWGHCDDGYSPSGLKRVCSEIPDDSFKSLSVDGSHACGVTTSGSLECWGGNYGDSPLVTDTPSGTFQSVSLQQNVACGLNTSGKVECWGEVPFEIPDETFSEVKLSSEAGASPEPAAYGVGITMDGNALIWGKYAADDHPIAPEVWYAE